MRIQTMNAGLNRYTFYLEKIKPLLNQAKEEGNPAFWLFRNNARTPFFMLESIARIYEGAFDIKEFEKLKDRFKDIEDGLGKIDFFQFLIDELSGYKEIPLECMNFFRQKLESCTTELNEILKNKKWISANKTRIQKIEKKLTEISRSSEEEEIKAFTKFYRKTISNINVSIEKTNFDFKDIEKDVHELRRDLRWLSIYPQSLQGVFQYATHSASAAHLNKYLTKEIVNSPYNVMPPPGNHNCFIYLNKNYFLSLSWMIAELGRLKDEGLLLTGLSEAMSQSLGYNSEDALKKSYSILGKKQRKMQDILKEAESISTVFFKEKNLDNLISEDSD